MKKDLTASGVARQNILNNRYALEEIQKAIGLKGVLFEGEYKFTKKQLAEFFEIDVRTLTNCMKQNDDELTNNGYVVLMGKSLRDYKLTSAESFGKEIIFPTKTTVSIYLT